MNAAEFKKLANKTFAANIRELGWKGSGFHYYKADPNHIVNIFGIQGSWTGGSVCCETAIHFDFIPDLGHESIDLSKTTYASCIIRKRLSPKGEGDYHWSFHDSEVENLKSINQIWEAFKTHGLKFYSDFDNFPKPFDSITPSDIAKDENYRLLGKYYVGNHIELIWLLKEINVFIGQRSNAKEFADLGLKKAIANADAMRQFIKGKNAHADIQRHLDLYRKKFNIGN